MPHSLSLNPFSQSFLFSLIKYIYIYRAKREYTDIHIYIYLPLSFIKHETGKPNLVAPEAEHGDSLDGIEEVTASPNVDGWFLSDSVLFEYLLRGQGHSQRWFTCVSPQVLVRKYGQCLHGNPAEHRRVALDKKLLEQHGNQFHLSAPDRLRSDFFHYLEEQCTAAAAGNQPVLVLMLSHGHPKKPGIICGGNRRQVVSHGAECAIGKGESSGAVRRSENGMIG